MSESLGPVSPPYWVLELWGDYEYALVYACVDLLVTEQEYAYFFASTSARPLAPAPVRPCLGANGTVPEWDGARQSRIDCCH